ncbi:MYND-type domain-containing protein [Mycena sanguinolenta]|uniref:MYND-type domain-containing protein n=1 Tax=Mycena sanguinolenta TaxID=230812 RepID=A0A8H6Y1D0_9AGAR|nr:MYND-type domain-containing protein [Mycena sanguinolenta]
MDFEYAQLLYDAGGDVNNRNRYGGTAAHEIAQIWTPQDVAIVLRATEALKWFLDHNGSVDIADSDGMTARRMTTTLQRFAPGLNAIVVASDRERKARANGEGCCALCGRAADVTMKRCGRCKVARYCTPDVRDCQKTDWPHHKKHC